MHLLLLLERLISIWRGLDGNILGIRFLKYTSWLVLLLLLWLLLVVLRILLLKLGLSLLNRWSYVIILPLLLSLLVSPVVIGKSHINPFLRSLETKSGALIQSSPRTFLLRIVSESYLLSKE
jgi:hypothetical protein